MRSVKLLNAHLKCSFSKAARSIIQHQREKTNDNYRILSLKIPLKINRQIYPLTFIVLVYIVLPLMSKSFDLFTWFFFK